MIKKAALIEENQRLKKENDDVKHKVKETSYNSVM